MKSVFTHWANLEAARDDSSMNWNYILLNSCCYKYYLHKKICSRPWRMYEYWVCGIHLEVVHYDIHYISYKALHLNKKTEPGSLLPIIQWLI